MAKIIHYCVFCIFVMFSVQSIAQIKIVTTIKPLHSIIKNIVKDKAEVDLLLDKNLGPHDYLVTPSKMLIIKQASLLIYIDDSFEAFVKPVVENFSKPPAQLTLMEIEGLKRLSYRQRGNWGEHNQEASDHAHDHGAVIDPHIWLDPANAQVIATAIAHRIGQLLPDQAVEFIDNANIFNQKISALNENIRIMLKPFSHSPFVVFHDSYQYFEAAFSLKASASMTFVPNELASVGHINHITKLISQHKIQCIFTEPQYNKRLVDTIIKNVKVRQGLLDPLGVELNKGQELIFDLYINLAATIKDCLTQD